MRHPPADTLRRPQDHSPCAADCTAALGSALIWTVSLLLTLITLVLRLTLQTVWALLRLLSTGMVYLLLTTVLLFAVLMMMAFHSVAFISGNFP